MYWRGLQAQWWRIFLIAIIDVRESSPLWEALSLGRRAWAEHESEFNEKMKDISEWISSVVSAFTRALASLAGGLEAAN